MAVMKDKESRDDRWTALWWVAKERNGTSQNINGDDQKFSARKMGPV